MELTVGQILDSAEPIQKLIAEKMPFKVSYWLSRNLNKMEPELKAAQLANMEIFKKYGAEKEKTGMYFIKPECQQEAQVALDELRSQTSEVDIIPIDIDLFTWEEIGESKTINVPVGEMIRMFFMFKTSE